MKALIWDFDGTLASRDGMWTGTLVTVASRFLPDRPVTRDEIRPFLQTGFPWHTPELPHVNHTADQWWAALNAVFARAYVGIGIDHGLAHDLAARVRQVFLEESQWRVFDDVLPCLTALQRVGWAHYMLSNHVPELSQLVHALGLSSFFVDVVSSGCTGYEKPHPEAFRGLLRKLPVGSTAWMIGDSLAADVEGAEHVGLPALLVRKQQPGARYYCESLMGIEGILNTQPGAGTVLGDPRLAHGQAQR